MNVLIVNDNLIGENNAVGYSMRNMLYQMPDVNYLQYCVDLRSKRHPEEVDTVFCAVSDSLSFRLKALLDSQKTQSSSATVSEHSDTQQKPKTKLAQATDVNPKRELMSAVFYSLPCRVSKANLDAIRSFHPDLIYTLAENLRVINQAIKLSKKLNIPIVYHGMDDWKSTAYSTASWLRPAQRYLERRFDRMNRYSVHNLAICKKMAEHYEAEYRVPYSYACNCILEYCGDPYLHDPNRPMKIVFSGGLHLHRGEVLQEIAALVEELNAGGRAIEMEIICPNVHLDFYTDVVHQYPHTLWRTYTYPQKNKIDDFRAADVLLLAESPRLQEVRYARYSFSTKVPEYLAIGRCILAYGSPEQASIQFVRDAGCGPAAHDMQALRAIIIDLYDHPEKRVAFAERARRVGREQFNQQEIQRRIYGVFKSSAESAQI